MSFCHRPISVVCHVSPDVKIFLNDKFSKTIRPRALIFSMKHCLVDFNQFYSNRGPLGPHWPCNLGGVEGKGGV